MASDDYDLFLSFRGKDTRLTFADVLYHYLTSAGFRVFRDDDELAYGDKIDSIFQAIESSKVGIVIFSKHFAESKWCLREVTRMVELEKIIVPVFYDVSPGDLKLKEGSVYADDFTKLQLDAHVEPVEIQKWKDALKAASINGRELGNSGFVRICKELLYQVVSILGPREEFNIDHFFGDTNKESVIRLLKMGSASQQVVYLGIHGIAGIGKTCISKLIYNEFYSSFDYQVYLRDIRELSKDKGVDSLPKYFCDNLDPRSITPFNQPEEIPSLFKNKKVLLILDDVNSVEQIKKIAGDPSWFGSGSKIIMTSRDKKVFEDFELASKCEIQYLEMEELKHGESLELFSRCAFAESSPPSSYQVLSERVVAYAGGLPLALIVVAKDLRNQKKVVWEEIIERLKKTTPKGVKDKFMISHNSLEDEENWYGSINILISKKLKDLNLSSCQEIRRTPTFSENMRLKRLNLSNCKLLKYIEPTVGKLQHLTVLNLSGGKMDGNKLENLPDSIIGLGKLEYLNLNYTRFLAELPESLGNLRSLRELNLVESGVARLPSSIIRLEKLEKLDLSYCKQLQELPKLPSSLKVLRIECGGLDNNNVPDLSNLQGLTSLKIAGARFNLLGSDIGLLSMSRLLKLTLDECEAITDIPIGEMQSLTSLTIRGCTSLVSLVNLDKLKQLRKLSLSECPCLAGIPGVGKLLGLAKLSLLECDSLELIDDITWLEELKVLCLIGCPKLTRVPGLANLRSLRSLVVKGCQSREILEDASQLEERLGVVDYSEEGHIEEEYDDDDDDDDDDDLGGGLAR